MNANEVYLIPDMEQIQESMALSQEYNAPFEYNDFFLPGVISDDAEIERRIRFYQSLERNRSRDTLHGAFLDMAIHSQDDAIRAISRERFRQSLSIAQRLGIRGVVFHANLIPGYYDEHYIENWLQTSVDFYQRMLKEYPDVDIYIENMFEQRPREIKRLAEAMSQEKGFGICLDYAHAQVFGKSATTWVKDLAPYIKHIHLNDNDLQTDGHWTIGTGLINWKVFAEEMKANQIKASVLVEIKGNEKWLESMNYMKEQKIYPW